MAGTQSSLHSWIAIRKEKNLLLRAPRRGFALVPAWLLTVLAPAHGGIVQHFPVIVVMGDSLTAGYGVALHEAYPALLEDTLRRDGYHYHVVNGGVNGDTTEGGLRRVAWVLRARPAVVIVAMGLNDGLRGLRVAAMRENLERIVRSLQAGRSRVLVAGMRLPSTTAYAKEFADAFPVVARQTRAALMPFLLDGVAGQPAFTQADALHPNAVGHRMIAKGLWPHLKLLLRN